MTMDDRGGDARGWSQSSRSSQSVACAPLQDASGHGLGRPDRLTLRQQPQLVRQMRASTSATNGSHMDEDEPFGGRPTDRDILGALSDMPMPSEALLRRLFDLTPAEARLAQALARGDSLEQVAQALNVKRTTARTQLGAIFGKTQTSRQAQLVAILSRLAHVS